MKYETSYGVIPIKEDNVLLIRQKAGHWCFPKGHPGPGESPLEVAKRELKEETGLEILHLLAEKPFKETYVFSRGRTTVHKTVFYYIAEIQGTLALQEEEIAEAIWVPLKDAPSHLTFPQGKAIAENVYTLLSQQT